MKGNKDSFWKVLTCIFLIWAFMFLWSSSIKVWITGEYVTIENKLTGNGVHKYISGGKWTYNGKAILDTVLNYLILLIFIGSLIVLTIYTIKALRNPEKRKGDE